MVFWIVLGGQMLAFLLVLGGGWQAGHHWERISLISLYVQWIGLVSAALLCLLNPWLAGRDAWLAGLVAWLLVLGVTALAAEVTRLLAGQLPMLGAYAADSRWNLLGRSLGVSGIVTALLLRYLYLDQEWRRQVEARSEARFQALQARIRPHFLFNSMNTVASLTRSDPRRAEAVVEDLADLFRAALSDVSRPSTLGEELELVRRYLAVEMQRLGERLRVEWDLEPLPEDAPLPLLVLQPLVENAVYHGVEPSPGPAVIRIAGRYRNHRINLGIRNTLPPEPRGNRHRAGNRIALDNVRERLQALYPGRASLTLSEVDGEFQVRVVLPYP
jgi:two-component system sensor histidine kinase AlgZ